MGPRGVTLALAVLSVLTVAGVAFSSPASAQNLAELGVTIRPVFPSDVTVGQTLVPAAVIVESRSLFPVVVTAISLNAGCANPPGASECAPSGSLRLSRAVTGAGSACPPTPFTVTGPDPDGRVVFVPPVPIVLPPFATAVPAACTLSFTFDAVRSPPSSTVHHFATLSGFVVPTFVSTVTGTSTTAIHRAPVAIRALAAQSTVPLGAPVAASAVLSPPPVAPDTPPPTGSVAFTLYRPTDTNCSGPPLQGPVSADLAEGGVVSPSFTPSAAGTYRWTVEYSGDANYAEARSACTAATAVVDASRVARPPSPTTTTAPVPPPPAPTIPAPVPPPLDVAPPPPTGPRQTSPQSPRVTGELRRYDPAAHADDVVAVQVSAFALLALLGTAASRGGRQGGGGRSPAGESRQEGEVAFTEVESAEEGLAGGLQPAPHARWGDRSWSWQWAGTAAFDRASRRVPARVAGRSPLLARVLNDAGYLRAMFSSASTLVPILGVVLGVLAVRDVQGQALPPHFGLAVGLAVLGVFDALAGLLGVFVFVGGVVLLGGLSSADAARTLLGLSTLWFAAPLIAGTARPLRRPPTMTPREHWDRTTDIVIASLVGAWAVQKVLQGLPGLSGLDLPIAEQANAAAVVVLGALIVRMVLETVAAHGYPLRLSQVQPATLSEPSRAQRAAAYLLILGIFLFAAVAYLGPCWQLYVGGALFILPKFLQLLEDRLPNSPRIYAAVPRGLVQVVLVLFVGAVLGALALDNTDSGREAIRDSFVLLSLPGFALAVLELFGREGTERELRWHHQIAGIPILVFGVLLALEVIAF